MPSFIYYRNEKAPYPKVIIRPIGWRHPFTWVVILFKLIRQKPWFRVDRAAHITKMLIARDNAKGESGIEYNARRHAADRVYMDEFWKAYEELQKKYGKQIEKDIWETLRPLEKKYRELENKQEKQ